MMYCDGLHQFIKTRYYLIYSGLGKILGGRNNPCLYQALLELAFFVTRYIKVKLFHMEFFCLAALNMPFSLFKKNTKRQYRDIFLVCRKQHFQYLKSDILYSIEAR